MAQGPLTPSPFAADYSRFSTESLEDRSRALWQYLHDNPDQPEQTRTSRRAQAQAIDAELERRGAPRPPAWSEGE